MGEADGVQKAQLSLCWNCQPSLLGGTLVVKETKPAFDLGRGMLELVRTSLLYFLSCCHSIGSLKSAVVGVFTLQNWGNPLNQGFSFWRAGC